jgi:hypothetical protein
MAMAIPAFRPSVKNPRRVKRYEIGKAPGSQHPRVLWTNHALLGTGPGHMQTEDHPLLLLRHARRGGPLTTLSQFIPWGNILSVRV